MHEFQYLILVVYAQLFARLKNQPDIITVMTLESQDHFGESAILKLKNTSSARVDTYSELFEIRTSGLELLCEYVPNPISYLRS